MVATDKDLAQASRWARQWLAADGARLAPPFSFTYGGKVGAHACPFAALRAGSEPAERGRALLLSGWRLARDSRRLDAARTRHTLTYSDPATGLVARLEATQYHDYPALEWVVYFENEGARDTPILEDVRALDFTLARNSAGHVGAQHVAKSLCDRHPGPQGLGAVPLLYHADGSHERITDFRPRETALSPGAALAFAPEGGRSSDGVMPYFNVARPDGGGVALAVGWTGQWAASFSCDASGDLTIRAGMERTHLRLHPGEKIRTPRILALFYDGDHMRGQNLLRSIILRHYSPTPGGRPLQPPIAASGATIGFNNVTAANQVQAIGNVVANGLPVNCWWIDAGWSLGGFPLGMGTWDPDPARFPAGLKPVGDAAHQAGLKFLVWFEPERVMPGTWLRENHPEWLLAPANLPPELAYQADWRLLDLGNPAALAWATRNFSAMIGDAGIDIYRHDFNMHPLYYWRADEAADRQGMNEIRYVTGLYDYLDTLAGEHPGLILDNSASGGRRLDLEMVRRCIPLLRTDYLWDPVGAQSMAYALSQWLPLHGQGAVSVDPYDFRSGMGANMVYAFDFYSRESPFWAPLTERIEEHRRLRALFTGDFYPLTPYSTANNVWIAYQFHREDLDEGMALAFRRAESAETSATLHLQGLDPAQSYEVEFVGSGEKRLLSGAELAEGLQLNLPQAPGSAVITYRGRE